MKTKPLAEIVPASLDTGSGTVWLQLGQLLDAAKRRCHHNAHLVYDSNGILHASEAPPPPELTRAAQTLNLPDALALPLLFDGHTHINLCGGETDAQRRNAAQLQEPGPLLEQAQERARAIFHMGVRALRDGGDKDGVGLALSSKANASNTEAFRMARVFSPGPGIHRRGRYGSFFSTPVEAFASEADCVASRAALGAAHIKIVPTGIINFAKGAVTAKPQFSRDEIRAFKEATAAHGLHLMAHASGEDGIGNAIQGGVDTIEHGYFITREQLAIMRDQNQIWVPTFAPVHRQIIHADEMGWDDAIVGNLRRILDGHAKSLGQAMDMGIEILIGSDAGSYGVPHAIGLFEEIWLMSQAGMPALEALCRAIHDNPLRLAPKLEPNTITAGREATFLLAPTAALKDARELAKATVLVRGAPVQQPEIRGLL
ncbi:MAG: amidohydrolase family protein [Opitutales bacterium]|nr:amidohydrolase family protein [Opitutales bacterium]